MPVSPADVRLIQDRAPGWEEAWGRLCVELLGPDGRSGELVRAVERLRIRWPSSADRDDFISQILYRYHQRAKIGTLFISYDPDVGGPLPFLLSHRVLYSEALRFCHSLHAHQAVSWDQVEGQPGEPAAAAEPGSRSDELEAALDELRGELNCLSLEISRAITRIVEQAGVQLYPRLDWSSAGLERLHEHLRQEVRPDPGDADGLARLTRVHVQRGKLLAAEIRKISEQIFNDGRPLPARQLSRLERRHADTFYRRIFLPLTPEIVMQLLALSKTAAEMYRSRYQRALPELLPGLSQYHSHLQCLRTGDDRDTWEEDGGPAG